VLVRAGVWGNESFGVVTGAIGGVGGVVAGCARGGLVGCFGEIGIPGGGMVCRRVVVSVCEVDVQRVTQGRSLGGR
jgi:hypothetical protein